MPVPTIDELLAENMTTDGYALWLALKAKKFINVWNRSSSSTQKYHIKEDGSIPTIYQHTHEMLYSFIKIQTMFGDEPKTKELDISLLSIALHDALKYGPEEANRPHTDKKHDKAMADWIRENYRVFSRLYSDEQIDRLESAIRYHSGKWSTNLKENKTPEVFETLNIRVAIVHILDMLSTKDCLK